MQNAAPSLALIETISDLRNWNTQDEPANIAKVPLATRIKLPATAKPSLMGFDMGEFQYDPWFTKWSQGASGTDGVRTASNVYNFSFWQYVDISYYFGHQLLTIPPTVWTNAAHKNGVFSLGTLNLNWNENEGKLNRYDVIDFLTKKPDNPDKTKLYLEDAIEILFAISKNFAFDGYLINLEQNLYDDVLKQGMLTLLSTLKEKGCATVWYDSPFSGEKDDYDNRLTQHAYSFFQAASYFQANYFWGPNKGADYPRLSYDVIAANSANPLVDRNRMFMGKDCGKDRGSDATPPYQGSFFPALALINSSANPPDYYTGLNLYYPAWDMYDLRSAGNMPARDTFHNNDQAFWTGTKDLMFYPDPSKPDNPITPEQCMKAYLEERSVITSAPFVTWFNDGEGDFYNVAGKTLSTGHWNNLSDQSILPTYRFEFDYGVSKSNKTCITHDSPEKVWIGGSSISVDFEKIEFTLKLFKTAIVLTKTNRLSLIRKQVNLKLETPILYEGENEYPLQVSKSTPLNDNWHQLDYQVPPHLAGKLISEISLRLLKIDNVETTFYLGGFMLLDTAGIPVAPKNRIFPVQEELDWSDIYNATSHYRVYGVSGGQNYLIGVVYNSVYRARYGNIEADHIFNSDVKGFSRYIIQEVNVFGNWLDV